MCGNPFSSPKVPAPPPTPDPAEEARKRAAEEAAAKEKARQDGAGRLGRRAFISAKTGALGVPGSMSLDTSSTSLF